MFEIFVMPAFHHWCDHWGEECRYSCSHIVWTHEGMTDHVRSRVIWVVEVDIFHIEIRYLAESRLHIKWIYRDIIEIDLVVFDHSPIDEWEELLRWDEWDKHRCRIDPCMDQRMIREKWQKYLTKQSGSLFGWFMVKWWLRHRCENRIKRVTTLAIVFIVTLHYIHIL